MTPGATAGAGHPALDEFVRGHAARGDWPGAAYAVGPAGGRPAFRGQAGVLAVDPAPEPLPDVALYDLASLTKPLALGAVLLRLADAARVDLDRPLADVLPEFADRGAPSFADLLLHRYGFPPWAPLYRLARLPDQVLDAIAGLAPAAERGTPVYSCLSAITARVALERATGRPLRALFAEHVARPLGMGEEDVLFAPLPAPLRARCAPTEAGRTHEATLAARVVGSAEIVPGPGGVLRGDVHDGNAAFLGGDAGNAGLFGTAAAVFRIASAVAEGPFLSEAARARVTTVGATGRGDARTFGFKSGGADAAPVGALGARAYGHNGFTGTSAWIAPRAGATPLVAVLLSNRLHPRYADAPIQDWRRAFHDAAAAACAGLRA